MIVQILLVKPLRDVPDLKNLWYLWICDNEQISTNKTMVSLSHINYLADNVFVSFFYFFIQ